MTMWLIAKHPGHGERYDVRVFGIIGGIGAVEWSKSVEFSLEDARLLVPKGAVRIPRAPDDDPRVVETWKRP